MEAQILTSLHGRLIGLDKDGRLITPGGYISGAGNDAGAGITGGEAGTAATYTAGKFLIELEGHEVI